MGKYIRRGYLFLLLLLPNLYAVVATTDLSYSPLKKLAYMVVVIVCLVLPAFILKAKAYFIVEGAFSLFVAPVEIASIYLNHATASHNFLELVYRTNFREAIELLSSLWFVALLLVLLWVSYFLLTAREKQEWLFPKRMQWVVLCALPVLLIVGGVVFGVYAKRIYYETTVKGILTTATDLATMKFYKIFPYNFYLNTGRVLSNHRQILKNNERLEQFSFGIEQRRDSTAELYVLVIGETARGMNFSLNGYERETNLRLQQRENVISYPNVYSQANLTSQSVPHILSRISVLGHDTVTAEKTLPEAFKEMGYVTAWLSNKTRNSYTDRLISVSDYSYVSSKNMSSAGNDDIVLISEWKKMPKDNKRFVVLHHMGSHWRYDQRYSKSFERWTPCIGGEFNTMMIKPQSRQLLLNAYDNSLLYTDYFLDSLISTIAEQHIPAVMLYISDHGENLYDDEEQLVMHGSYMGSEWELNVPCIVWYSDEYMAAHPEKVEALHANQQERFSSDVVFHTMLDMAGETSVRDSLKSLSSVAFCSRDTLFAITGDGSIIRLLPDTILR